MGSAWGSELLTSCTRFSFMQTQLPASCCLGKGPTKRRKTPESCRYIEPAFKGTAKTLYLICFCKTRIFKLFLDSCHHNNTVFLFFFCSLFSHHPTQIFYWLIAYSSTIEKECVTTWLPPLVLQIAAPPSNPCHAPLKIASYIKMMTDKER